MNAVEDDIMPSWFVYIVDQFRDSPSRTPIGPLLTVWAQGLYLDTTYEVNRLRLRLSMASDLLHYVIARKDGTFLLTPKRLYDQGLSGEAYVLFQYLCENSPAMERYDLSAWFPRIDDWGVKA